MVVPGVLLLRGGGRDSLCMIMMLAILLPPSPSPLNSVLEAGTGSRPFPAPLLLCRQSKGWGGLSGFPLALANDDQATEANVARAASN